jgi:amino acid transporter
VAVKTDTRIATAPAVSAAASTSVLRSFHPGWFGAVMGTAIVGVSAFMNPGGVVALQPLMRGIAVAVAILAYGLACRVGDDFANADGEFLLSLSESCRSAMSTSLSCAD